MPQVCTFRRGRPCVFVCAAAVLAAVVVRSSLLAQTTPPIRTVFVIEFENQNWSNILNNPAAPYINSLLPKASRAEQYYTPPGIHASTPNYLWLEAGQDFGLTGVNGFTPALYAQTTANHLATQLANAGISWKTYQESMPAGQCPLTDAYPYVVRHNQFVFFTDITNNNNPASATCIAHVRPYSELATDLAQNTVARYNFITPNVCNDMHDCSIATGDAWLASELPKILSSTAYVNGGAVFITWDEGDGAASDGPIGMIVLSPAAKGNGYANSLYYTHSSLLLTIQEIFGVRPLLGDAANAVDLSDLFASFPAVVPSTPTPVDGTSGITTNAALRWSSSGGSDDVYFGTTNPPPLVATAVATQSYTPATLVVGATYYWQVVSKTAAGTTPGPLWKFTTGTGTLPWPWTSQDVGAVGVAGSTSYATGAFTVKGAGADIWGTADAFQLVSQAAGGTLQITARVTSLQNTSSLAKAGVTLRDTAAPGSAHVTLDVKPDGGVELLQRSATNGTTAYLGGASLTFPVWLRLTRAGTTVSAAASRDGVAWVAVGTAAVTLPGTVPLVGLATSSHTTTATTTAVIDRVALSTGIAVSPASPNPADGASGVSTTPTLTWTAAGATSYDLDLGTANPPPATVAGLTAAAYAPAALLAGTTYFWQIVAHDSFGTTAGPIWSFTTAGTAPPPPSPPPPSGTLPSPWVDQDVGSTGLAGSASYSNGVFTIRGAGADIWGAADAFNYAYEPFSGDGQIVARVTSLQNTNTYAKAGVMFRDALSASSAHVLVDVKPDGSIEFMQRATAGGTTTFIAGAVVGFPAWLRLNRTGALVTASWSTNGLTWTTLGSTTVSTGSTVAGLAVTSHTTSALTTAAVDNVTVSAAATGGSGVNVWLTTADQLNLLTPQPGAGFAADSGTNPLTIDLDDTTRYQQMDGFGASFTDSSAWLVYNTLSTTARGQLMTQLFDPQSGIGLSYLRQPMGASDFALTDYTYDDMPPGQTDPTLSKFSIAHDQSYIIPVLQQARQLNPALRVIASPWSPPAWMKAGQTLLGGSLDTSATTQTAFASYFVKFIQQYAAAGVPIQRISPQNEPLNQTTSYPSMYMDSTTQANFIAGYLGPALAAAGLTTQIVAYDHNWDNTAYASSVLASAAGPYVAGTAWHCYSGTPDAMTTVHNLYPAKDIYFDECTTTADGSSFGSKLLWDIENLIIGSPRNWARVVTKWNVALDQNYGPHTGGCGNCMGLVTIDRSVTPPAVTFNVDYYTLGHVSKFVQPGAYRIASNTFGPGSIEDVAFQNPDGSEAVVVLNSAKTAQTFKMRRGTQSFSYTLPAGAVATFTFTPPAASQLPSTPASPVPADTSTGVATNATLSWLSNGATSYTIRFGTTNPPPQVAAGLTAASYAPSGMVGGTKYYWQVVAINGSGSTTGPVWSFTTAAPLPAPLPSPWTNQDIGKVSAAGSASFANGVFTVSGAGDIGGKADALQFVYQPLAANGQIVARVGNFQSTNSQAQAGLMIRGSLAANSVESTIALQPGGGVAFMARTSTGGITRTLATSTQAIPRWLKLVRSNSTITVYVSADGAAWATVGSASVPLTGAVYVGLAVTSHAAAAATATFDNVSVSALP